MASIELKNVSVKYPIYAWHGRSIKHDIVKLAIGGLIGEKNNKPKYVAALNKINIQINDGDRLAILGHNGSGKTTLLKTIAGLYFPQSGKINTVGRIHSLIDIMVGVDYEATGRENIFLRCMLMGLSKKEIKQYEEEIIEFAELNDFIDLPIRMYSSGMAIRLAFAIATVVHSEILIMDEWLSVGDHDFQVKAKNKLLSLVDKSNILVVATHNQELVNQLCNRKIILESGSGISDQKL